MLFFDLISIYGIDATESLRCVCVGEGVVIAATGSGPAKTTLQGPPVAARRLPGEIPKAPKAIEQN